MSCAMLDMQALAGKCKINIFRKILELYNWVVVIVLGNDWMKKYNPTKFDHEKKCVTIGRKGNKTVLHAIPEAGSLSFINGSSMGKLLRKGQTLMAHLFMVSVTGYLNRKT